MGRAGRLSSECSLRVPPCASTRSAVREDASTSAQEKGREGGIAASAAGLAARSVWAASFSRHGRPSWFPKTSPPRSVSTDVQDVPWSPQKEATVVTQTTSSDASTVNVGEQRQSAPRAKGAALTQLFSTVAGAPTDGTGEGCSQRQQQRDHRGENELSATDESSCTSSSDGVSFHVHTASSVQGAPQRAWRSAPAHERRWGSEVPQRASFSSCSDGHREEQERSPKPRLHTRCGLSTPTSADPVAIAEDQLRPHRGKAFTQGSAVVTRTHHQESTPFPLNALLSSAARVTGRGRGRGFFYPAALPNGLATHTSSAPHHHGRDNHPSCSALQAYRIGIAAVTGIDPADARDRHHFIRRSAGWRKEEEEKVDTTASTAGPHKGKPLSKTAAAAASALSSGPRWVSVGQRLTVSSDDGGAGSVHDAALYDVRSGTSRKVNEVPPSYFARLHAQQGYVQQATRATSFACFAQNRVRRAHGRSLGREEGAENRVRVEVRCAHDTASPGEVSDTHSEDNDWQRRLYWAEASQSTVNAALLGVSEAEKRAKQNALRDAVRTQQRVPGNHASGSGERPVQEKHALGRALAPAHRRSQSSTVASSTPSALGRQSSRSGRERLCAALRDRFGEDVAVEPSRVLPSKWSLTGTSTATTTPSVNAHPFVRISDSRLEVSIAGAEGTRVHRDRQDGGDRRDHATSIIERHGPTTQRRPREGVAHSLSSSSFSLREAYSDNEASWRGTDTLHTAPLAVAKEEDVEAEAARLLLFPPLLTPLLQEVDECLHEHQLGSLLDIWRSDPAEQDDVLRAVGFSRRERQTILWELERMIRVTSTTCAIAV